jgi:hypothetical protein
MLLAGKFYVLLFGTKILFLNRILQQFCLHNNNIHYCKYEHMYIYFSRRTIDGMTELIGFYYFLRVLVWSGLVWSGLVWLVWVCVLMFV